MRFPTVLLACASLVFAAACLGASQHHVDLTPNTAARRSTINKRADAPNKTEDWQDNSIPDETSKDNELDTRITISEPYKSIIQTTTRFALAQSRISKYVNIDTAMNLLSEAAHFLAKPTVLLKTLKLFAVTLATFVATGFLFPSTNKFVDAAWRDPMSALNLDRYLTNGLEERSVIEALGSKTDETLSSVGLQLASCRQRSLCYLGEVAKCSFPHTADTIIKFVSDNFAESNMKENLYARAFVSGFVDRNCTSIGLSTAREAHNCLGSFFKSLLSDEDTQNRVRK